LRKELDSGWDDMWIAADEPGSLFLLQVALSRL
jgi:hypothetical protein